MSPQGRVLGVGHNNSGEDSFMGGRKQIGGTINIWYRVVVSLLYTMLRRTI